MVIPKEIIEEVRSRCDIVELISSYLPELSKRGATYKSVVHFIMKNSIFYSKSGKTDLPLFGCGANGDVFSFVQEYDKLDFLSAVQLLIGPVLK